MDTCDMVFRMPLVKEYFETKCSTAKGKALISSQMSLVGFLGSYIYLTKKKMQFLSPLNTCPKTCANGL